jgi:hypothetical protein
MKEVTFTTADARRNPDHATPHQKTDDEVSVIPGFAMERAEPAGSIHASARDLAQLIRLHLNAGTFESKRLVSAEALGETQKPQNAIPFQGEAKSLHPETKQMSYGMAWVIEDYHGRKLISHAGQIDGFRVHLTLMPEERVGVVLLNNLDRTQMNLALSNTILDHLLRFPTRDWNAFIRREVTKESDEARTRFQDWLAERDPNGPPRPLADYAGTYSDPAYDSARVMLDGDKLIWKWSTFSVPLAHHRGETFYIDDDALGFAQVVFTIGADGKASAMRVAEPLEVEFRRNNPSPP